MGWGWARSLAAAATGGVSEIGKAGYDALSGNAVDKGGTQDPNVTAIQNRTEAERYGQGGQREPNGFVVPPRQPNETDEAYVARVRAARGSFNTTNQPSSDYGGSVASTALHVDEANRGRYGGMAARDAALALSRAGVAAANGVAAEGRALTDAGKTMIGLGSRGYLADRGKLGDSYAAAAGAGAMFGANTVQDRLAQQEALKQQYLAATGKAPSQAELLMRANADANQRAQMAQAAGMRGGNALAGMRSAQAMGAQNALAVGNQAGALRAQEMADARAAFANQANTMFGGSAAGLAWGTDSAARTAGTMAGLSQDYAKFGAGVTELGLGGLRYGADTARDQGNYEAGLAQDRETAYLNWLDSINKSNLSADVGFAVESGRREDQKEDRKWGMIGTVTKGAFDAAASALSKPTYTSSDKTK